MEENDLSTILQKPTFAIFEGGGAKGLAHVGALRALEDSEYELMGVAGASAGALIAALVAVGYTSRELFDFENPTNHILRRELHTTTTGLIGQNAWDVFRRSKDFFGLFSGPVSTRNWLRGIRNLGDALYVGKEIFRTYGYFTASIVQDKLNQLLRAKLLEHAGKANLKIELPKWIRFRDIDAAVFEEVCSLSVIVTDVTEKKMIVFDGSEEFRDVVVAEAVAASISIPFFFKPAAIPSYKRGAKNLYGDGGMVSNFPIWVFAEEKLALERQFHPRAKVPIIAFSLLEDVGAPASPRHGWLQYVLDVAYAGVFGGQSVTSQFVNDVLHVELPVGLKTTEFSVTSDKAISVVCRAYLTAKEIIRHKAVDFPGNLRAKLEGFQKNFRMIVGAKCPEHFRLSIIQTYGRVSFRVMFSWNMEDDADDNIVFGDLADGAPTAFRERQLSLVNFDNVRAGLGTKNVTKYEIAQVRPTLKSAICVPIFPDMKAWEEEDASKRPIPAGVFALDSDSDLKLLFEDNDLMTEIAIEAASLYNLVTTSARSI